ncbi:MAG TPA: di-heme oxidoredictase family protein [Bryobacteraceae bacterium]|nr:di-heme oxidoredictase family protein [Bryobacteraceae bacterium]
MLLTFLLLLAAGAFAAEIPRTWDAEAVAKLEVPLANVKATPVHISEADYYAMPERKIYRSYPVYHPAREPRGYQQWLAEQEPQIVFDISTLKSEADWIRAGEFVFQNPLSFGPVFFGADDLRDPAFFESTGMPVAKDGTIAFARWVIRQKGKVELGSMGCNTCHTRVLPDGTVVPGAQGNNPGDRQGARSMKRMAEVAGPDEVLKRLRLFARQFEAPWVENDPNRELRTWTLEAFIGAGEAIPPGVTARSHTSLILAPQIPDLIGVQERRFLDHTGIVRHNGIGDLMRYVSLVQDTSVLARYADSAPMGKPGSRYSDEQLYALARYLYSLKPPPNPNRADSLSREGGKIFEQEGCSGCHTAPLYTNNKLVAVDGFEPTAADRARLDVMERRVGTDPRYALQTRKGTGYYKVPSLKGVWYRGALGHQGAVQSLEAWLSPARLSRVKGHEFGLKLNDRERRALVAFLRTL